MIDRFEDEFAFLSNFYVQEVPIKVGKLLFNTNEHFYQAHKTLNFEEREWIVNQPTPAEAKHEGRKVQLREDWGAVKDSVMHLGLVLKFVNNYDLAGKLLATGSKILIEGNYWHDNYWGDCDCERCTHTRGLNRLGLSLMSVRSLLASVRI